MLFNEPNLKLECVFEEAGDKLTVCVHLFSVPAGVGNHNRRDTLDDCIRIRRHVDAEQAMQVDFCVVLIDALCRPAITYKVLRASSDLSPANVWNNKNS